MGRCEESKGSGAKMGEYLLKAKYHIFSLVKIFAYKILYAGKFSVGGGTTCRKSFNVYIEHGAKIIIGKNCFFNHSCSLAALDGIKIGDGCLFGENVKVYDHNHRFSQAGVPIKKQGYTHDKITIGDQCWICSNVTILKGVHIGDNCVIGAGCVIKEDVQENTIVQCEHKLSMNRIQKDYRRNNMQDCERQSEEEKCYS